MCKSQNSLRERHSLVPLTSVANLIFLPTNLAAFKDFLKEQSHGDFPIFFVTSLINLYQSTLLIHELLLDHKGTILNEFSKEKTGQN